MATTLTTPDGRYIVVRGRLWRASSPGLSEGERTALVSDLMLARRQVKDALKAKNTQALEMARAAVDHAKVALGERGPLWWADGAPDLNRKLVRNTPYADWFSQVA